MISAQSFLLDRQRPPKDLLSFSILPLPKKQIGQSMERIADRGIGGARGLLVDLQSFPQPLLSLRVSSLIRQQTAVLMQQDTAVFARRHELKPPIQETRELI